jgi:hypothetical protein
MLPVRYDSQRRMRMSTPTVRFRIDFSDGVYVGPGKIDLLIAIRDSGSLSRAAKRRKRRRLAAR